METNCINQRWYYEEELPKRNWLLVLSNSDHSIWVIVSSNDYIDYIEGKIKEIPLQNMQGKKIVPKKSMYWKRIA